MTIFLTYLIFHNFPTNLTFAGFSTYCFILITISLYLSIKVAPRHGNTNVLVYTTICNMVGALTVLCGKGLGIAGKHAFDGWFVSVCRLKYLIHQFIVGRLQLEVFRNVSIQNILNRGKVIIQQNITLNFDGWLIFLI